MQCWHGSRGGYIPLARPARHHRVHGIRPVGGDGGQPAGRPSARRRQSADRWPTSAGRAAFRPAVAAFSVVCVVGFFAATLLFLPNRWPLILAGPVLCFIAAYSLTKRFTVLAHFWLGASLMLAPLAAWIAIRGLDDLLTPTVLGVAVLFWVAGFDILYACQDVDVDRRLGLHSVPAGLECRRRCDWRWHVTR